VVVRIGVLIFLAVTAHGADPIVFDDAVRPILAQRCQGCHPSLPEGAIKPGDADASPLIQVISGEKPRMPKAGVPLTSSQIAIIRTWIQQGAKGMTGEEKWWSLRPLTRPEAPRQEGAATPVDAFIRKRLQAAGLTASPEADRRTLARRLYFDLHGLPPTPEELSSFVNDSAPDAYDKLVDRLLESPRYGERWARHWLDTVHYGDSHGYDKDKPRPNAWPYRDYVIQAFNEDKPYSRFIREQLAGDVLFPGDVKAFVATGFLAAGPWDFVGHQELREGTTDKDNTRLLDRDDMVATTMSTFTSTTAHCARCHDHKFDPIPQQDYYNLQAVFAGIDRADRAYYEDAATQSRLLEIMLEKRSVQMKLQPLLDRVEFTTSPEIVDLDSAIQDAGLQIAHIGPNPKDPADAALRANLETRRIADRERKRLLVEAIVGRETYTAIEALKSELTAIDERIAAMPPPKAVYSGANFFKTTGTFRPALQPRTVLLKDKPATPGALTCVPSSFTITNPGDEGNRRAALANWITADDNILTWRSIVNRVWHYHFGTGLVDTPNDFGRMGSKPSHPELLDWLATWFRDDAKGSMKSLHRLILRSAVYRQQSVERKEAVRLDADNRLLWRMNRTRLDAEAVRDSVLAAAGKLNLTMGGPAEKWFVFKDDHSPVYDYDRFDPDTPGAYRRSIYRFIVRSVPDPFMERLDCPDPSILTPRRSVTLTAIQALTMLNNPFVVRMSQHFAERLRKTSPNLREQITTATSIVWNRPVVTEEYEQYVRQHGLENFCRLLFNSSEFLFVD
jgi:hypothetical protein